MQQELTFGGLSALDIEERIAVSEAVDATNCLLDYGDIRGRNGYRAVTASAIGSGTVQFVGRFRPNNTTARTVVVRGGVVWVITDPTTESASDGLASSLGSPFGASANISGAQLGKYFYLTSDETGVAWQRITPALALEAVSPLAKLAGTGGTSTPSLTLFSALTDTYNGAALTLTSNFDGSGWEYYEGDPLQPVEFNIGADQDWSARDWLLVYVSPMTRNSSGVYPVEISVGNNAGQFEVIGTTFTNERERDSPSAIFCPLRGVSGAVRSAVRKIKFRSTNPDVNTNIMVYGYIPIPVNIGTGIQTYYVTYWNSSTRQVSELSEKIEVVLTPFTLAPYPHVRAWVVNYYYDADESVHANPITGNERVFNLRSESTIATPSVNDLVPLVTISGTSQVAAATADKIRLYKLTTTGIRLVKEITNPGVGVGYSIVDDQGDKTLTNELYRAGGTPPPTMALAAVGTRLLAGGDPVNANRVAVSSGVPFAQSTDPFPQFPPIAVESADGWSYDVAPAPVERVLWEGLGDIAGYVGTSEAMYYFPTLAPNTIPYKVYHKGLVGRRAACWIGDNLAWCGVDGIYLAQGRAYRGELTKPIRKYFKEWFLPDSTVLLAYKEEKIYAVCGTRMLRLDLVKGQWTRHNLAHTMLHAAMWSNDPNTAREHLWFLASNGHLYRWQDDATSDAGTAIADWTYSTGFLVVGQKTSVRMTFLDAVTGSVTFRPLKDMQAGNGPPATVFAAGESELPSYPLPASFKWRFTVTGANTTRLRRMMIEQIGNDGQGGS